MDWLEASRRIVSPPLHCRTAYAAAAVTAVHPFIAPRHSLAYHDRARRGSSPHNWSSRCLDASDSSLSQIAMNSTSCCLLLFVTTMRKEYQISGIFLRFESESWAPSRDSATLETAIHRDDSVHITLQLHLGGAWCSYHRRCGSRCRKTVIEAVEVSCDSLAPTALASRLAPLDPGYVLNMGFGTIVQSHGGANLPFRPSNFPIFRRRYCYSNVSTSVWILEPRKKSTIAKSAVSCVTIVWCSLWYYARLLRCENPTNNVRD